MNDEDLILMNDSHKLIDITKFINSDINKYLRSEPFNEKKQIEEEIKVYKKKRIKNLFNGVVYKYTNKNNGRVYIGETIDLNSRQRAHKTCKGFSYFHQAIEKEGFDIFDFEIICQFEGLDKSEIKSKIVDLESFYINEHHSLMQENGYNFCRGAQYGKGEIYWALTNSDNQIYDVSQEIVRYKEMEDWERFLQSQERLPILISEREKLRILLGAKY